MPFLYETIQFMHPSETVDALCFVIVSLPVLSTINMSTMKPANDF